MKSRLSTHDIVVLIQELKIKLVGLRVDQVYDLDKKSYLIRLAKTDMKKLLLIESGSRFHTTSFEWPKNPAPSGFTMKLRKHLNNKRLENISQLGADRVVDFQFGQEAFTFHVILELYDKGNIILTDQNYNILSLVRPHVLGEDRIAAHEKYAVDKVKTTYSLPVPEIPIQLKENPTKTLREVFLSKVEFGPALLSFVLKEQGLTPALKIPKEDDAENYATFKEKVIAALERGRLILETGDVLGGFILINPTPTASKSRLQAKSKDATQSAPAPLVIYDQFHPLLLAPNFPENQIIEFPTLDEAVDDFFSKVEAQKIDLKQVNQERDALNKLERVKADQQKRIDELKLVQEEDKKKAELIMFNQELIEKTIAIIRQLIANQLSWDDIWEQIKEAQQKGDPLASKITALNLIKNRFSMHLRDPYEGEEKQAAVEIDLDLSAYANASKYYDLKKASAKKEERTFESQEKALKSTEKKTMTSLREVATIQLIKKARKVFWFEKFRWFISSENYLVLGGQDAQQNELLVKRYMKPKDIYLHAEAHGAPTIIIKNDGAPNPVLPKTLNEAGAMAICASGAWETKIVPSSWWVWGEQVSKSAPTGEYLPTGSFMIRGKKNFLPPTQLVLGFGFLFRLSDESMPRHLNERGRRVHTSSIGEALLELELERKNSLDERTGSGSDEDDEDENEFPDTKLELDEDVLGRSKALSGLSLASLTSSSATLDETRTDDIHFVTSGTVKALSIDATKMRQDKKKADKKKAAGGKGAPKTEPPPPPPPQQSSESAGNKPKRGQHGRKKKLKEKYKFQDEEERELRMQLLQAKTKGEQPAMTTITVTTATPVHPVIPEEPSGEQPEPDNEDEEKESNSKPVKTPKPAPVLEPDIPDPVETPEVEINLLNSLTGSPVDEDELLFAIPVIAPYATLQNYKYRIKMLPGSTKRGKAARNAVEGFIRDKQATAREKDLLKSVKDQDLARNFPGKVKLAGGSERK